MKLRHRTTTDKLESRQAARARLAVKKGHGGLHCCQSADSTYKGPLCQERNCWSEPKLAEKGLTMADPGRHWAEPVRSSRRSGT
jgi:hypothetical protein